VTADVVIVGGGIIGCATAYYLARAGTSVLVLERGRTGGGASHAAAGMLAPLCEAKQPGPFMDLLVAALADYPRAVEDIESASGAATGYRKCGILRAAFTEDDEVRLDAAARLYPLAGLPFCRLAPEDARREEPALSPEVRSALLSPDEGQVNPRQVTQAFRRGAEACGARFREFAEVRSLTVRDRRVRGVEVGDGVEEAATVVVAAGAWSALLPGPCRPPVHPVRGQIAALRSVPFPVRRVLYSFGGYVVPWPEGRLVLGATQEDAGFEARTTVEGIEKVLAGGRRLLPGLRLAEIDATWAGLRPGAPDGEPLLGPITGCENLWMATGHFRNGILLGPYTARLVAESILSGIPAAGLGAFSPQRF
jgi:glycine oxidase